MWLHDLVLVRVILRCLNRRSTVVPEMRDVPGKDNLSSLIRTSCLPSLILTLLCS